MKIVDLPVEKREKLGSAHARRYRRAGQIPCVLYGHGKESLNLLAPVKAFEDVVKQHTALVRLQLGADEQTALLRDVTWDTFGEYVEHIDMVRVGMEDEVTITVPVHCVGTPVGASEGGELHVVHPEVEVYARVDSIPSEITVDVSHLNIDDGIQVGELTYPPNVRPVGNLEGLIVHVTPPKKLEELLPETEEEEAVAAEGEAAPAEEGEEPSGEDESSES